MEESKVSMGTSDPVSYTCTCGQAGSVLLFYRYWANSPVLPEQYLPESIDPEGLAQFHRDLGALHCLGGKVRISKEGFNITIAGSDQGIREFITACCSHWSFSGLDLEFAAGASPEAETQIMRDEFFKPTPGCRCVFGGVLNIRVTAEITPLGVTNYAPSTWEAVRALEPQLFHQKCLEENVRLIDVRNHYESRIGYFVSPKGGEAIKPPIRRFSQWPQWVKEHGNKIVGTENGSEEIRKEKPQVLTYCTGGIRCEKGVRWMQEYMTKEEQGEREVYTLKGGIAAYLTWMEDEIVAGRKSADDSLFKGRNYVFDARGSTGLADADPVSTCHSCGIPSGRLGKCRSPACHLVLVVCSACELGDVRCCNSCRELSNKKELEKDIVKQKGPTPLCECEQAREKELWDGERVKEPKTQGWRKKKAMGVGLAKSLDIRIKLSD